MMVYDRKQKPFFYTVSSQLMSQRNAGSLQINFKNYIISDVLSYPIALHFCSPSDQMSFLIFKNIKYNVFCNVLDSKDLGNRA